MRGRRAWGLIAAGTLLAPAAVACTGGGPAALAADSTDTKDLPSSLTGQRLDWEPCGPPEPEQGSQGSDAAVSPPPGGGRWECATMTAPVDYADPEGDTLGIALVRARAKGGERIGSLVFNFGGPGGSGVATLPAFGQDYAALRERYDLVSFDPRGVGASEGVVCLDDQELDTYFAADAVPETARQRESLTGRLRGFADACEDGAGGVLGRQVRQQAARDLDLLREVLGDDKLHYFGISYGTQLGGVYAHLFPRRLGRAVFDAVVDPTLGTEQSALGQARGFQRALGNYLDECTSSDACPLGDTPKEAERRLGELLDRLDDRPMPTQDPDGRRLTQSLAWNGIAQALYSRDFWPYLTQGLDDALTEGHPDGTVLLGLGDAMNGRNPDGSYTTLQSSLAAIGCADSRQRFTVDDVRDRLDRFREVSPVFGPGLAWSLLTCTYWPVRGDERHPEVSAEGAPPILLIGTTGDPATPYEGTRRMKEALGEDVGVELTYEGEGHGAYNGGDGCVREAADAYLLRGEVPEDGTTCPARE
jgi:pimeloyl-ACP methyl ester carboxylesterase